MSEIKGQRQDSIKTKQDLSQALIILMLRKSLHSITISQIAKQAGYSRQTFYQHFSSKEEVVDFYLDQLFYDLFQQIKKSHETDFKVIIYRFCLLWQKHSRYIRACVHSNLTWLLFEKYFEYLRAGFVYLHNAAGIMMPSDYELRYIAGGQANAQINWILEKNQLDAKKFAKMSIQFTSAIISTD